MSCSSSTASHDWTPSRIAALSDREIASLNYDEMLELVAQARTADVQIERFDEISSEVLVRLVYAARAVCRKQTARPS